MKLKLFFSGVRNVSTLGEKESNSNEYYGLDSARNLRISSQQTAYAVHWI